jgi:hypothetical protein
MHLFILKLAHTLNHVIGEKGKTPIRKFSNTQNSFTNFQSKESQSLHSTTGCTYSMRYPNKRHLFNNSSVKNKTKNQNEISFSFSSRQCSLLNCVSDQSNGNSKRQTGRTQRKLEPGINKMTQKFR